MGEKRAICTWILPRGKRPNRSHTETKVNFIRRREKKPLLLIDQIFFVFQSMLLTGHYIMTEEDPNHEPLFIVRCEQILSSIPNVPTNSIGSTSTTTLRFVLTDQLKISEISSNVEYILGCPVESLIDQAIDRIIPSECLPVLQQAKENCRKFSSIEH